MTGRDLNVLREAIRVCRESSLYHTLGRGWRHEAIMHAYQMLVASGRNGRRMDEGVPVKGQTP